MTSFVYPERWSVSAEAETARVTYHVEVSGWVEKKVVEDVRKLLFRSIQSRCWSRLS